MTSAPMRSAPWIAGSEVTTIWMSSTAMNMPKDMAAKPIHSLAGAAGGLAASVMVIDHRRT